VLADFRLALGFLTIWPVRVGATKPGDLGRAAGWFPLVGLLLGLVLSGAQWLLLRLFPPLLVGGLLVALWAALTGGLHLDGLADCGDGLWVSATPERRLEIMRDARLGAFGGLALALFLILKTLAAGSLPALALFSIQPMLTQPVAWLPFGPLVTATVCARWLILPLGRQRGARPGGLGADFALGLRPAGLIAPALFLVVVTALGGGRALVAVVVAHGVAWLIWLVARGRLGGVTGDILGLTVELSELAVLLVYAARPAYA
jgi:adenosylcobinamide-GDP ribazoletransferase